MNNSLGYDGLKHRIWVLGHNTYDVLIKSEDAMYGKAGLTHQKFVILLAIECMDDPITVSDLARWTGRNTSGTSMIVDRMERDGLVEKIRDLPDRRSVRLVMTDKGKERLIDAMKIGWELVDKLMSCLSEKELDTFAGFIMRIREKAYKELVPGEDFNEIEELKSDYLPKIMGLLGDTEVKSA